MAPRKATKKEDTNVTDKTENDTIHVGDLVYDRSVLDKVYQGTVTAGVAVMVLTTAEASKLVELGLIQANPNGPDSDGNIEVALTDKGTEAYNFNHSEEGKAETEEKKTRRKSDFSTAEAVVSSIEVPIPPAGKRGRTGEKYPFGTLTKSGAGNSFHIPAKDDKGNNLNDTQAKELLSRLTSSVSTANTRYADIEHPVDKFKGAKFIARAVGDTDPQGRGVRVWRTA